MSRGAIAPGQVKLFAHTTAAHASSQSAFFNQSGMVGVARAQYYKNSAYNYRDSMALTKVLARISCLLLFFHLSFVMTGLHSTYSLYSNKLVNRQSILHMYNYYYPAARMCTAGF